MAADDWGEKDTSLLKVAVVICIIALIFAVGSALYFQERTQFYQSQASRFQTAAEDADNAVGLQSLSISSLEAQAALQYTDILLSGVTVNLGNSSTLVLSYNSTAIGYIMMNGTAASMSWVVACYGVTTQAACQSSVASGTGYALMAYTSGMKVPVLDGPMVIMMSTDDAAGETIVLTAEAFT